MKHFPPLQRFNASRFNAPTSQPRQRFIPSAAFSLLAVLLISPAHAALESGVYQTLPGATVVEFGDRVPGRQRAVPFRATVTLDLASVPPSLTAQLPNAVLEGGDPFPLTVTSSSAFRLADGTVRFDGDYLRELYPNGTQYLFDWRFSASADGQVTWNGNIGWAGGHLWIVTISNLTLVPAARLSIARAGTASVQLSWPANLSGFVLEQTARLPAADWSAVTNTASVLGDRRAVTVDATAAQRFYRLRKP